MPELFITSVSIDNIVEPLIYCPDDTTGRFRAVGGLQRNYGRATIEMEMELTPGAHDILSSLMRRRGGFSFGEERREWKCVWCAVPNEMGNRFCSQCGGPRGWLL